MGPTRLSPQTQIQGLALSLLSSYHVSPFNTGREASQFQFHQAIIIICWLRWHLSLPIWGWPPPYGVRVRQVGRRGALSSDSSQRWAPPSWARSYRLVLTHRMYPPGSERAAGFDTSQSWLCIRINMQTAPPSVVTAGKAGKAEEEEYRLLSCLPACSLLSLKGATLQHPQEQAPRHPILSGKTFTAKMPERHHSIQRPMLIGLPRLHGVGIDVLTLDHRE
ncbi:hypothetical protein BO78DRAFT_51247 [Aspergillus sclerotiicarbonarius CBS 121057]|uniref:Uncharacterized protein n=1 Tax=Aspergillus sclerotiicarbonarius (strain CBS 121057 / IBT 28362) TaxID=1448318 RepID=A0A319EFM9_ASPSB|nr:hypothetical protein BO78DRAFT_51247 [Aspergillus sclerotiicarbonarius CBS 121057]